jgi:hypothetical protein
VVSIRSSVIGSKLAASLMLAAGWVFCGVTSTHGQAQAINADSIDVEWPRQYTSGGITFTVYQPQLDEWKGDTLRARAAVAAKEAGKKEPTYGVICWRPEPR